MSRKARAYVTRILGGMIFGFSLFIVGPALGTRATLGIIVMILGLGLASVHGTGLRRHV